MMRLSTGLEAKNLLSQGTSRIPLHFQHRAASGIDGASPDPGSSSNVTLFSFFSVFPCCSLAFFISCDSCNLALSFLSLYRPVAPWFSLLSLCCHVCVHFCFSFVCTCFFASLTPSPVFLCSSLCFRLVVFPDCLHLLIVALRPIPRPIIVLTYL